MRNLIVLGVLIALILISFIFYGAQIEAFFEGNNAIKFFDRYGNWAWLVAIALLIADLFLPLPGTIIMSALGFIYGPFWGGMLATLGNFLSGVLAYWLCRSIGKKGALWILGEKDFVKGHKLFNNRGGYIVSLSRWLPILPEAVSCMAGLNRMQFRKYWIALISGSLPLGFIFAYIGHYGSSEPALAITLSAILPLIIWIGVQYILRDILKS